LLWVYWLSENWMMHLVCHWTIVVGVLVEWQLNGASCVSLDNCCGFIVWVTTGWCIFCVTGQFLCVYWLSYNWMMQLLCFRTIVMDVLFEWQLIDSFCVSQEIVCVFIGWTTTESCSLCVTGQLLWVYCLCDNWMKQLVCVAGHVIISTSKSDNVQLLSF